MKTSDFMLPMDNLKRNWSGIVIMILIIVIFFLINNTSSLEKKVIDAQIEAKEHETKAKFYLNIYKSSIEKDNALKVKYDSLLIEKQTIKKQYYEKIKLVDKYSVYDMQSYFDERYKSN
jgi:hypothetical protein